MSKRKKYIFLIRLIINIFNKEPLSSKISKGFKGLRLVQIECDVLNYFVFVICSVLIISFQIKALAPSTALFPSGKPD